MLIDYSSQTKCTVITSLSDKPVQSIWVIKILGQTNFQKKRVRLLDYSTSLLSTLNLINQIKNTEINPNVPIIHHCLCADLLGARLDSTWLDGRGLRSWTTRGTRRPPCAQADHFGRFTVSNS